MQVQVEVVSPGVRALKVTIPSDVVSQARARALADFSKTATLPGFRPGKVPFPVLQKKYGASLDEEVVRGLVSDHYEKAVEQVAFQVVGLPVFQGVHMAQDATLSFTTQVEVAPVIVPLQYTGIEIPRSEVRVGEADVQAALSHIQDEQGMLEVCPDEHAIAHGDYAVIRLVGSSDGAPLKSSVTDYTVRVGEQMLPSQIELPLLGKKKGETFDAQVAFPASDENKAVAGKTVLFHVTVTEAKQKTLPAIDDDLAKDAGFDTLSEMREHVVQSLLARGKILQAQHQKDLLLEKLRNTHDFEIPPSFVEREIHALIAREASHDPQDHQALHQKYEANARARVKHSFLLHAIADAEKIEVTGVDVEAAIERDAMLFKIPSQEVRTRFLGRHDRGADYKWKLLADKVLDRVLALARFVDAAAPDAAA